jgi:preprotein translocase subunit YajC
LLAKISDIDDNFLTCKISNNVEVKIQRHAVASVMPKGTIKNL